MIRFLACWGLFAILLGAAPAFVLGQESESPATPAAEDVEKPVNLLDDPEFQAELKKRGDKFDSMRDQLEQAIGDQRETYIRYLNHERRDPAAQKTYFDQRQKVRHLLDETFDAALDFARLGGNEEAVTYLITMIQHRNNLDIYDSSTLEAASRLIDSGSRLAYLFLAAARSAVVVGDFDLAKRLFEAIEDEHKEDVDRSLAFGLDRLREVFEREQSIREQEAKEDRLPRVKLQTTQGDVVLELFLDQAPSTVSHFIKLVEQGFYDGVDFYQVVDHVLALTGDPTGLGSGHSGQFLLDEHQREDSRGAWRGSLLMAKIPKGSSGEFVENSASSQFAILLMPLISATEEQTVFGRVIEGMDVVSRLRRVDPSKKKKDAIVIPPDRILEATVIRRPDELPEPKYVDLQRS